MKKILIIIAVIAMVGFSSCRTNEANYKAAYEKAKEKQMDTGDDLTTQGLKNELLPKDMVWEVLHCLCVLKHWV